VLAIASLTLRSIFALTAGPGGHVLMPCRADGLMLGVCAALVVRDADARQRLAAAPAPLQIAVGVFGGGLAFYVWQGWGAHTLPVATVGYSLLALFYVSLLLLAVCRPTGAWARLMRVAPLRRLGKLAYCLYLVNEPVLALTRVALRGAGLTAGPAADLAAAVMAFVVSVAISELSWRVFESKLLAIGQRFSYHDGETRPATVAPISAQSPGL
jgi:peptidoglycan/LPS O-acetylase OafA/YrhL